MCKHDQIVDISSAPASDPAYQIVNDDGDVVGYFRSEMCERCRACRLRQVLGVSADGHNSVMTFVSEWTLPPVFSVKVLTCA